MIDFTKIKKNYNFILISVIIIVVVFLLSLIKTDDSMYESVELGSGEVTIGKLVINEVMSSNGGVYADNQGNINDYVEIYNGTDNEINLKGYMLSDSESSNKWSFPEIVIKKHEYIVINLTGENKEGLYANFKLNSGGEKLFLRNMKGKVVDAVDVPSLDKNEVLIRNLDGTLNTSKEATPGFINSKEGRISYLESLNDTSDIKINEILPDNNGNYMVDELFFGYIEIINEGSETVNLTNYSLSNDLLVPFKYQLPNISISPNEVIVITMDGNSELSTSFKLNNKNGVAILTNNKGKIIDKIEYSDLANGYAIKRQNGEHFKTNIISPGYLNTSDGEEKFSKKYLKNNKELIINEVNNNNYSYLPQNGDEYYDYIELKNNSNDIINLSDYYLSTGSNKYKLPEVELKQGELYILMASGNTNLSNTYTHIDFKLSDDESLYLYKGDKIIDSIYVANVPLGYSMGRNDNNGYYYMLPSPLEANKAGVIDVSIAPAFDGKTGIYNDVDSVNIKLNISGKTYYTLDGSTPTTSSKLYNDGITLNKTSVVKAITIEADKLPSEVVTNSYIINEHHTLPVLSLSLDNSLFNYINGNPSNTIEVASVAELYEDNSSFKINCGLQLFGGSTRYLPKKSYALKFKKKYGESSLKYKVFENRDFSEFDTLVVRSGSQDYESTMFRDELMSSLVDGLTNIDVQSYKAVILYVNGEYHGIYYLREKVDEEFVSNHYNVDASGTNVVRIDGVVSSGVNTTYQELLNWIENHDLSNNENYEYVKSKIDIESFADFWACETYVTNNDIINQRFFQNSNINDNRWKWIYYDLDYAMYNVGHNYYLFQVNPDGMSDFKVSTFLMRNLIKNKEFKETYLKRISYVLNNVYTEERVLNKIDELYNLLSPEMERECEQWGNSMSNWKSEVEKLRNYAKNRTKYMITQTKSYFNLTNDEVEKYFGDL